MQKFPTELCNEYLMLKFLNEYHQMIEYSQSLVFVQPSRLVGLAILQDYRIP